MRYVKTFTGRYQQVTNEQLRAMRYIPENSIPVSEEGLGVVYVSPARRSGYYHAVGYQGNAAKSSFNYIFKTDAQLDQYIEQFFNGIRAHKKAVADRRANDFKGHNFQVGDIVTNSWGYDQTNVDWYAVTKTSSCYIWLRRVQCDFEATGFMCGRESIKLDANLKPVFVENSEETKHRASGNSCSMRHGSGNKHTGGDLYSSSYA